MRRFIETCNVFNSFDKQQNKTKLKLHSTLDILKLMGLFFTRSNYPKCKIICTSGNLDL